MKMNVKIILLGILCTAMNVAYFIGLYHVVYQMQFEILIFAAYLIPAAINCLAFWNALEKVCIKKQLILFAVMAGVSLICYAVFAYFLEAGAEYVTLVENNLNRYGVTGALRGKPKGRFFSALPFICVYVANFTVQYIVNGTKVVMTPEEIEKIFKDKKKK